VVIEKVNFGIVAVAKRMQRTTIQNTMKMTVQSVARPQNFTLKMAATGIAVVIGLVVDIVYTPVTGMMTVISWLGHLRPLITKEITGIAPIIMMMIFGITVLIATRSLIVFTSIANARRTKGVGNVLNARAVKAQSRWRTCVHLCPSS